KLQTIQTKALAEIQAAQTTEQLYQTHVTYLGRKGELTMVMQNIATLSKEEKPAAGKLCNEVKKAIEAAYEKRKTVVEAMELDHKLQHKWVDITAPGKKFPIGHVHPISQVQYEVEQIFSDMGFSVMDGPEIESEYYNFEGLNIPAHHPARDMQDTFFVKGASHEKHKRLVLRTHTSPVQVRTMEKYGAPLRVIVPGRVFRNEATDARHEHTFNQVEGLLVDEHITIAHLKGVMQEFLTRLFGREMNVRFRPGYFPFVEPGIELDMSCTFCGGSGCKVCKYIGWIEFMGAGMVHPNVLKAGGIDPEKYQGWAFGFGLTRLVMMRYNIDDIRYLSSGDVRFLEQF
ncbi:phenylalanine--tRNA ligase subunit alpha, partial [Candidatus Gracilibacteria bacterium]|nr:phenylalanine--tRNA ligase subunit alpha [Candidatus Gracilibacteria bacterium]